MRSRLREPTIRLPRPAKTVLIIASRFPPVASVGAIRIRKFVKYLDRFGWRPVVITGAVPQHSVRPPWQTDRSVGDQSVKAATDPETLRDLPEGLPLYRLSPWLDDWPGVFSRRGAAWLTPWMQWMGMDEREWRDALAWRCRRVHDWAAFPDSGIWRLGAAVRLALRLHRRFRFDAIVSSGMPFSDHLIALALRRILRRPWLADFRDPWFEYIHQPQWNSERGRRLTRMAEAAVVRKASFVISVNEHMTRRFVSRYPRQRPDKFVTIQNGFDPEDFAPRDEPHIVRPLSPTDRSEERLSRHYRLVYAGSLYGRRNPAYVLKAFREFVRSTPGSGERAVFEFLGRPGPHLDQLKTPSPPGRGAGKVRYIGMLPYREALRAMAEANLNVVLLPKIPGSVNDTTAKVYECLGSGRPVLAAVPLDGAAAAVLRRFDGVTLCDPDDVAGMVRAMRQWYARWLTGPKGGGGDQVLRSASTLAPLTRLNQTRQLAACLTCATGGGRRGAGVAGARQRRWRVRR